METLASQVSDKAVESTRGCGLHQYLFPYDQIKYYIHTILANLGNIPQRMNIKPPYLIFPQLKKLFTSFNQKEYQEMVLIGKKLVIKLKKNNYKFKQSE